MEILFGKMLSEVGFEPTPSYEDQKSRMLLLSTGKEYLESGALDRSAILTIVLIMHFENKLNVERMYNMKFLFL